MKPCKTCGSNDRYAGSRRACRPCARLRATRNRNPVTRKLYYQNNRSAEIANTLRNRNSDPDSYLSYMNEYYDANRENTAKHYTENPDLYKNRSLKTRFGWSLENYFEVLNRQGGVCAICSAIAPDKSGIRKYFFVDHDHETLEIRGLLCHLCNFGLGCYLDDPDRLRIAAKYLEFHIARLGSGASLGRAKPKPKPKADT